VILSADDLHRRSARIRTLLRPVARAQAGPATESVKLGDLWIIGTHDEVRVTGNYRDWRFATPVARHHAMYFEAWKSIDGRRFRWQSAALNIYRRMRADSEEEIICLHCDPADSPAVPHARYKRGPHIHVSAAGSPLKRAHLALHVQQVDAILQRCDSIHEHLASGVQMIRDEVLDLLVASGEAQA
jgi:hypothetical protein